ncbi:MAG: ATP synthase F1 subunit epsilon [Magnetococcus sp. WYHC-3]
MTALLHLDVITPQRRILAADVQSVTIPGVEGDFGVLPRHSSLLSGVRIGRVTINDGQAAGERLVVWTGVAEVQAQGVTLLVEQALSREQLDPAAAQGMVKAAESALAELPADSPERPRREQQLLFARECARLVAQSS